MRRSRLLVWIAAAYVTFCAWGLWRHWTRMVAETQAELVGVE